MTIQMYAAVKDEIMKTIGAAQPESGGILACCKDRTIIDYYFDIEAGTGKLCYIPSKAAIERQLNDVWSHYGYYFGGFVHSHPANAVSTLSSSDIRMAETIIHHNQLDEMLLMVVHNKNLYVWLAYLDEESRLQLKDCSLTIV